MPDLDFPYHFSGLGRTATTDRDDHIRDLIQQVLFTAPGERVMRPDFGAGLLSLVFEPNSTTLAAATSDDACCGRCEEHAALRVDVTYGAARPHDAQRELHRSGRRAVKFHCCDLRRLDVLRLSGTANAIDFLEVLDKGGPPAAPRQQTLFVRLLRPGFALTPDNIRITGGERITRIGIVWCAPANALPPQAEPGLVATVDDLARTLVVRTDSSGDFSTYTLSIVASSGSSNPPAGFDPRLSSIDFSFKVEGLGHLRLQLPAWSADRRPEARY
ncbi:GPW/gp25 family protein [Reyranella sp.]|uniref:GPW/gp25 family protein n=1 Tax=Reyranella sp. TaxID=1929291 RepID=UPI0037847645